ncbi:MAG: enolase C-terminal domain-like protein [Mangrovibacterium sp.]
MAIMILLNPDATVVGGIKSVIEIFKKANMFNTDVYVHCWGGPVCMAANYHAALAAGGNIAEWPIAILSAPG